MTLEFSNTTPLPARIYAGEGCAQVLFFESDGTTSAVSYKDRGGKYQGQHGVTLPRLKSAFSAGCLRPGQWRGSCGCNTAANSVDAAHHVAAAACWVPPFRQPGHMHETTACTGHGASGDLVHQFIEHRIADKGYRRSTTPRRANARRRAQPGAWPRRHVGKVGCRAWG